MPLTKCPTVRSGGTIRFRSALMPILMMSRASMISIRSYRRTPGPIPRDGAGGRMADAVENLRLWLWVPEFTNEVQHFLEEVLRCGGATSSFPWKIDARLPGFLPMATRSGKSRQLWIARHQQFLGN